MKYRQLYDQFLELDPASEQSLAGAGGNSSWNVNWRKQHFFSWIEFLELLWSIRNCKRVDDFSMTTGTINLGITLLTVLQEAEIVKVHSNGDIFWPNPIVPDISDRIPKTFEKMEKWLAESHPRIEFGQLKASIQSSAFRAAAMVKELPPFGRSVLFIGDDDLTSLVLANRFQGEIVVADIDVDVLNRIKQISSRYKLDITVSEFDIRKKIPDALKNRFDTIHCDPVDDGNWLELWLKACIATIAKQVGTRIFLSINPRRLGRRYLGLHKFLIEQGFLLEHRYKAANNYILDDQYDKFYSSHLTRLKHVEWGASTVWSVQTDILVFRYHGPANALWPQSYTEIRRGV